MATDSSETPSDTSDTSETSDSAVAEPSMTPEQHRLYWHSRRGMLELEFVLVPFVKERVASLSADQQSAYAELLACEDWEIFDWLQQREVPPDPLREIVDLVRSHNTPDIADTPEV